MANRRKRDRYSTQKTVTVVLSVIIAITCIFSAVATIFMYNSGFFSRNSSDDTASISSDLTSSTESAPSEPQEVYKVSTATVVSTGDLLMHLPIITHAYDKTSKTYNFDNIFTYLSKYTSSADYAVANLETTLRGLEGGATYSGYPKFNCPDEIVLSSKNAGFDMLLTANNHSYDTRIAGMQRTLEVIDSFGVARLGIVSKPEEKRYAVKEINGIKIGMTCFTYETGNKNESCIALNGIPLTKEASALVNAFNYNELDKFYETVKAQMASMREDGAEAYVLYIHWGNEYRVKSTKQQDEIAQGLCNLGIDVIIGGHPHVVEPIELFTSKTDPEHKTVCLYSLGNAVSNQRTERMDLKTGHTEDGMLFSITFAKYSDGKVVLEYADILPTWVNLFTSKATGKKVYQIIPLDKSVADWKTEFDLTDTSLSKAEKSYDRTMKIVGTGLTKVQLYLTDPEAYKLEYEPISSESKDAA